MTSKIKTYTVCSSNFEYKTDSVDKALDLYKQAVKESKQYSTLFLIASILLTLLLTIVILK